MKIYNWGILGTAKIGRNAMIPALQASKNAKVAAVASREIEKARRFAKELNISTAYGDYQTLLDDPSIDIIYNPLPNHMHKPFTIKAAEAGKHILCEKPLGLNADECLEMNAAAKANGVQLMESFMYRHHPRIMAVREMVQNGTIGAVKTIESAFTINLQREGDIRFKPEMGGGAVMDVGCYCINFSRFIAGREPETVQARAVYGSTGVDIQMAAILDFGEGLLAHFDCGFNQQQRQRSIISGTEGFLVLRDVFLPGKDKSKIVLVKDDQTQTEHFPGVDQYQRIAEDFMVGIETGKIPYPPEDAAANLRVIRALLESSNENGKPITI